MEFLIILPALICFTLAAIGALSKSRERRKVERINAERAAARSKTQRRAKPTAEPAQTPKRKRGRPRKAQPVAAAEVIPAPVQPDSAPERAGTIPAPFKGNNMFAHHVVSFTGTLEGMTRAEAIKAVEANGGRAYAAMPVETTLLVVGDKPGMSKLDKADQRIGQMHKITQAEFFGMLAAPLTVTPDEFAAAFAAGNEV